MGVCCRCLFILCFFLQREKDSLKSPVIKKAQSLEIKKLLKNICWKNVELHLNHNKWCYCGFMIFTFAFLYFDNEELD